MKNMSGAGISTSSGIPDYRGDNGIYSQLQKEMIKINAQKIAVAHNANDNAETILMRITRGCGLDGLCGIKPVRDNIIRPLIEIKREDIESYCKDNNLNPRIDLSNLDKTYTRNKIRLELIPYLEKEFNEKIINIINRMSNLVCLDAEYINLELQKIMKEIIIKQNEEYIIVNLDKINMQPISMISRILRCAVERLQGHLTDLEYTNIEQAVNFINNAKTGTTLDLPKGLKLKVNYKELIISKFYNQEKVDGYNYRINIPGRTFIKQTGAIIDTQIINIDRDIKEVSLKLDKYTQAFDYNKLSANISLRTREKGDRFAPSGMLGTKKLKDYFIDQKIPREFRETIPLIAQDGDIIWIIGYRLSERYKIDEQTKKVIIIKYILDS